MKSAYHIDKQSLFTRAYARSFSPSTKVRIEKIFDIEVWITIEAIFLFDDGKFRFEHFSRCTHRLICCTKSHNISLTFIRVFLCLFEKGNEKNQLNREIEIVIMLIPLYFIPLGGKQIARTLLLCMISSDDSSTSIAMSF